MAPALTERTRRVWAATQARALGRGGAGRVAQATGLSPATIRRGLTELGADAAPLPVDRVRTQGGGRKRATVLAPTLLWDLDALVEPTAPGDPESPRRRTCLSTRTLAVALEALPACKRTSRRAKGASIRTGTRSFATSCVRQVQSAQRRVCVHDLVIPGAAGEKRFPTASTTFAVPPIRRKPRRCSSRPTRAGAAGRASASGRGSCSSSPTARG